MIITAGTILHKDGKHTGKPLELLASEPAAAHEIGAFVAHGGIIYNGASQKPYHFGGSCESSDEWIYLNFGDILGDLLKADFAVVDALADLLEQAEKYHAPRTRNTMQIMRSQDLKPITPNGALIRNISITTGDVEVAPAKTLKAAETMPVIEAHLYGTLYQIDARD